MLNAEEPLPGIDENKIEPAETTLYEGTASLPDLDARCSVTAVKQWLPQNQVKISIENLAGEPLIWSLTNKVEPIKIQLDGNHGLGGAIEVWLREATYDTAHGWLKSRSLVGNNHEPCDHIGGFLINFADAYGTPLSTTWSNQIWNWLGRTSWTANGWEIIIDGRPDLPQVIKKLKSEGGFTKTHAIRVHRSDGTPFGQEAATEVMTALNLSLSFLLGREIAPVYGGRRPNGTIVWEEWSTPRVDELTKGGGLGVWNPGPQQSLADMAAPLMSAYLNTSRRSTMRFLLQSYQAAARKGFLEQRILNGFAALEHLAWVRLVQEDNVDARKVDSKNAAWRLRQLLAKASIEVSVPAHLSALAAYARPENMDAPGAVSEVRHLLTHPKDPDLLYSHKGLLRDCWLATIWWLSFATLHWAGYTGPIVDVSVLNRWAGEIVPAPWSPAAGSV